MRAVVYVRISRDRVGAGLGVERQEQDCRLLAARVGAEVVQVFVDNDLSAFSGKPRPGYQSLLAAIAAGSVDTVLAWHTDRLHRLLTVVHSGDEAVVDVADVLGAKRPRLMVSGGAVVVAVKWLSAG